MSCKNTLKRFGSQFASQTVLGVLLSASSIASANEATRLVFTGDILLSREVQREVTLRKNQSPWSKMKDFFKGADWLMGNLEGSVGTAEHCAEKVNPLCFAVSPQSLAFPKSAGFTALGIENNHSADLGSSGRIKTREELLHYGISAIDFQQSPGFFKDKNRIFSFIALSNVPSQNNSKVEIPSSELRQKIRLAKSLSDWVIVFVHWGTELTDWPQPAQKEMARWLIDQGADVILGHHPHVVQPPECIRGKPVFFSLGNHIFDQKYPATKHGLIADCTATDENLFCSSTATTTSENSSFPEVVQQHSQNGVEISNCRVSKSYPLVINGYRIRPRLSAKQYIDGEIVLEGKKDSARAWSVAARRLLALEKGRMEKAQSKEFLLTLETHPSSIDKEVGPRPYVYEVTPHGLTAKWRGSALAWPLLDAKLIPAAAQYNVDLLCALHRKDSFVALNPNTRETRTAVYKWNGFGFSGVDDLQVIDHCEKIFH